MDGKNRTKWTYFGEFFEDVAQQSIDELEAVKSLLAALRGGLAVAQAAGVAQGSD